MAAAATWQIQKIHAIGRALGIKDPESPHDDDLHQLVQAVTGKTSIKELTTAEAGAVIAELQRRQGKPPAAKQSSDPARAPGGTTAGQQRKVWALMYQLAHYDKEPSTATMGDRLCGIIKKDFKCDATPQKPFAWLDYKACNRLIEAMKKYVANAARKAGDST